MATTVNTAFKEFMKNIVNLDPDETSKARRSRDWLIQQIDTFESKAGLPKMYSEIDIHFGSFARRTKIRELDDIDIMIGLSAQGGSYETNSNGAIELTVPDSATTLLPLCHDYTKKINSRKVINKFISELSTISQYKKAEIKRNQEAATLELNTYTWNFDIAPCFMTKPEYDGRTYYLIPDGNGNWKKTDPRLDRDNAKRINTKHNGKVLDAIRIIKYWNRRATMPTMPSYLLECILLSFFDSQQETPNYIDWQVRDVLLHLSSAVYSDVQDPKRIQGNLNNLTYEDKQKISSKALTDYYKTVDASQFETDGDHKSAINKWREIFGSNFPEYTVQ
ncbi:nucleotidyltransferase [Cohnella cellulosilytica]|uniref:Nucleotidyltransferase n=1 Tax=Cohnella cellulosilytica TaxID=986710 RepID=A0ABW2FBM0_9BACL